MSQDKGVLMAEIRSGGLGFFDLDGKVAVVTGGSSGIGAACARRLAEAGATVVVGYNTGGSRAQELIATLPGTGHSSAHIPLDDSSAIHRAAEETARRHGSVDVLVNSAYVTEKVSHADLEALTDEAFDRVLTLNVRGTFSVIRAFTPLLRASGDAAVANISSISAFTGLGSSIAYCAAKAALDVMTASSRACSARTYASSASPRQPSTRTSYPAGIQPPSGHRRSPRLSRWSPTRTTSPVH